jgi:hypothetical protein
MHNVCPAPYKRNSPMSRDGKDKFYQYLDLDEETRALIKWYRHLVKKVVKENKPVYLEEFRYKKR